ncbi:MAG: substrate-binding domain-containing protein [Chloroflexota bacterium]
MRKALYVLMALALLITLVPAATAAPVKQEGQAYTVQKDDWLWKLAEKYLGDPYAYPAIALATNAKHAEDDTFALIWNMDLIEVGDKLWIPSAEEMQAMLDDPYTVQVETKDIAANNPFWATVWKGAEETAERWWTELVLNAPTSEADVDVQIAQVEDAITKGVDALVVAPTDASALNPAFDKAKEAGIPVLVIDSNTTWPDKLAFIGTDNKAGGKLAGEFICGELAAGDEVAIITGHMTAQSIADRVNGSKEAFAACGVEVVAELNGEHTREGGQSVMEDIITANPDVKAVFCANDNMALGAVEALKAADKLAGVIVVGFDANPDAAASILASEMTATIAQSPYNMGGFGVVYGLIAAQGNTIPELIDTGTTLVTAENAADYAD